MLECLTISVRRAKARSSKESPRMTFETLATVCKYGLLASTLFIFKDRACNNEKLHLRCPLGTNISIRWAQYGRPTSSEILCPPLSSPMDEFQNDSDQHKLPFNDSALLECLAPSSLQVVMNLCENQRQCRVKASPNVFGSDPCPGIDKVLKVGYQCQPAELINQTACRGSTLEIRCSSKKRIAIHSALYGYSPEISVPECASSVAYDVGCASPCSMQIVARRCHGKQKCRIEVSDTVFGRPCQSGTNEYLVVVYACVALRTLKEIQSDIFPLTLCKEEDKPVLWRNATRTTVVKGVDQLITTSSFTSELVPTVSVMPKMDEMSSAEIFLDSVLWTLVYVKDNREKFILYAAVASCIGALFVLLVVILRLSVAIFQYRRQLAELRLIEVPPHSPVETSKRTLVPEEGEIVIERSVHPSPEPERQRRGAHRRSPSPRSPAFAHLWDSPVFVHVESPHESPILGQQAPASELESPVWVRLEPTDTATPPLPITAESPVWQLTEELPPVSSHPSLPTTHAEQMVNGSRPLAETRSLSMSYTNPYRHDQSRTERRSHSVRPSRHRLPFD